MSEIKVVMRLYEARHFSNKSRMKKAEEKQKRQNEADEDQGIEQG